MAFHLAPGTTLQNITAKLTADRIQPILFMSKLLSAAETRYHSTELEVAGLV
jgi:hypothetical protein